MRLTDTVATRAGEELPLDSLNAWLAAEAPAVGRVKGVEQFPGGFSNLTYLLKTSAGELVLRGFCPSASCAGFRRRGRLPPAKTLP